MLDQVCSIQLPKKQIATLLVHHMYKLLKAC